jgi:hypothetical protein
MDGSTGVEPADQSCGNREIPRFRPTALDIAQAPPRLPLRISEVLPATAPRAARGRADAGEAVGCAVVATTKLAPLASKMNTTPHPPPPPISYPTTRSYVKKIRPLANHIDFVSGGFLSSREEIANLMVMVIISLRSFSSNPTAEDQTKVTASSS